MRLAAAEHEIEEVLAGVDDQRAGALGAVIRHHLPHEFRVEMHLGAARAASAALVGVPLVSVMPGGGAK